MLVYITSEEQEKITKKIQKLPKIFRDTRVSVAFFEALGTFVLSYGACVSMYKIPVEDQKPNEYFPFLLSCFFYFALSISAPFSGGMMNPALTIALHKVNENNKKILYICSQLVGAFLGALLANSLFDSVPLFYKKIHSWDELLLDGISEAFGTFILAFFTLYATQASYISGEYFKYLVLSIYLFASRMYFMFYYRFTLRLGVLNPAFGLVFQIFSAYKNNDIMLFLIAILPLVLAPFLGAFIAPIFLTKFYLPLKEELLSLKETNE